MTAVVAPDKQNRQVAKLHTRFVMRDFFFEVANRVFFFCFRSYFRPVRAIPNEEKKITIRDLFVVNRDFFLSRFKTKDHESRHDFF